MHFYTFTNIALLLLGFPRIDALERGTPCSWNFCDVNAICTDLPAYQYSCECKPGYTGNGRYCKWQNGFPEPCASNPCDSNANCRNLGDSYFCSCKQGYEGDGKTCTATFADPCDSSPCHPNATCTNLGISYTCTCNRGYVGDGKSCIGPFVYPCDSSTCHPNATCTNLDISYTCTCNRGYVGDGKSCIEPCASNPCHSNATCTNQGENHFCACKEGYVGDGKTCEEYVEPLKVKKAAPLRCSPWILGAGHKYLAGNCGSWRDAGYLCCVGCRDNYKFPSSSRSVVEIRCTRGGFWSPSTIEPCLPKQVPPPRQQILPCDSNPCDPNASCRNDPGDWPICTCNSGFSGDGTTCDLILPCDSNPCDPNASCRNDPGDWPICTCNSGFSGDGTTCDSITCRKLSLKWPHVVKGSCGSSSRTYVGARCTVECTNNYKFSNSDEMSHETQCQLINGLRAAWSSIPNCIAMTCPELSVSRNHVVKSRCGSSSTNSVGTRCTVKCKRNYIFSNSNQNSHDTRCQLINGRRATWSSIPNCTAITCPELSVSQNHVVKSRCGSSSTNSVGTRCTVECKKNYTFSNSNQNSHDTQCQLESGSPTATWSSIPDCAITPCSKSCGGGRKISKQCGALGICSRVYGECNTHICPKDLKEAEFVTEQLKKAILVVSSGNTKNTDEKGCVPKIYRDYQGRIRMMGKSCPRRVKRSHTQSQFQVKTKRDAIFLIDESGSVGEEGFKSFVKATTDIVNSFCKKVAIGKKRTRVSVVTFDSTQHDHIHFNTHYDKKDLTDAIEKIRFSKKTGFSTCIVQTLRFVKDKMFTRDRGARMSDESTEKVIFLLSDGCENCLTTDISGELGRIKMDLTEKGISIITIFVGNPSSDCLDEMQVLGDTHRCNQTFIYPTFQQMAVTMRRFADKCISKWKYDTKCKEE